MTEPINRYTGYLVVCRDDLREGGNYVLVTRKVLTLQEATRIWKTIAKTRAPLIVGLLRPIEIVKLAPIGLTTEIPEWKRQAAIALQAAVCRILGIR